MDLSLKPIVAELLPGFATLAITLTCYFNAHLDKLTAILKFKDSIGIFTSFLLVILAASWIIGTFLDSFRNGILECALDKKCKINRDFFYHAQPDSIQKLKD